MKTQFKSLSEFLAHIKGKKQSYAIGLANEEKSRMGYLRNMTPRQKARYQAQSDYDHELLAFLVFLENHWAFGSLLNDKHKEQAIRVAAQSLARDEEPLANNE